MPQTAGKIAVDGHLDEEAWADAVAVELTFETQPGENIPARVKTVGYLVEDGVNLYVGFVASDPDPSAIRAYLRDRDAAYDDDFVGIIIDTYNDGRRGVEFLSTPLGVQMDLTIDEARRGDFGKEDDSWDAIWESAGQINTEGYVVEMKIPLTQLRFPDGAGVKTWGFDLSRSYPRERKFSFSNNALLRGNNCYLCQIGKFDGLKDVKPGRNLEVVPTVTASRVDSTEEPGIDPLVSGSTKTEAGLSVRWGITPDLTANLAINPDFSQVEADAAQLDVNNRFELFYPEKRPFFLEGSDYFTTPMQAVFTRTIARPDVGVKLTGKRGDNTFGVLLAEDTVTNLLFPGAFGSDSTTLEQSNSVFIGRYSRGFGETSSIGGVLTVRDGDGYHNYVGGFDARWKINEQHTLSAQYLESKTEYPVETAMEFQQPNGAFDGTATQADYEFDSRHWFANARYSAQSEGFRVDSGFKNRVGDEQFFANGGRVWYGDDESWWSKLSLIVEYDIGHLEDGTFREKDYVLRFRVQGPLQSFLHLAYRSRAELENGVLFDLQRTAMFAELTPISGLKLNMGFRMG
ncbi:MAG: carbohydrate binding family 9 domain-containing protein, partial [Woeseiaceae bacterium]|nr:carbohydrate binding family 9 domain-containing protein [Woeseiaceae bacterium]